MKRPRIHKHERVFSIRLRVNQGPFDYRMNGAIHAELFGGPCVYLGDGLSFPIGPNVPCQRSGKTSIVYTF
jgi:hypothetical protein